MSISHLTKNNPNRRDVQLLTEETVKLLRMNVADLYATLGGQLLGAAPPSRVAGIVTYLAAVRSASDAKALHSGLSVVALHDWGDALAVICEELKKEGVCYLSETTDELREALNNEDLLLLSDEIASSHIQVILMVVAAVLRLPPVLDGVASTVTAILLKQGLRNFCRNRAMQEL
jgi:hypothetical protein